MVAPLQPEVYRDLVRDALAEDRGRGDVTSASTITARQRARGVILAKAAIVIAGLDVAAEAFRQAAPSAGAITILDTRKTTPGFRVLEKYAVRCGGGSNHRQRLDDGILIKDNHKRLAGDVRAGVERAMRAAHGLPVEIEVETLEELDEVLKVGVPRILLDNFTTYDIREAITRIAGRAEIEISGGVTLAPIPEFATTGAQYVSVGALTHLAPAADLSFELEPA